MKYYKALKDLPGGVYRGSILKVDNNVVISQNSKLHNSGYLSSTFLKEQDLQMTEYFEESIGVSADNYVLFKGDKVHYEFEGQVVCGKVVNKVSDADYYVKENVPVFFQAKSFLDLGRVQGYSVNDYGNVFSTRIVETLDNSARNIFNTESQAKSALAYAQLSQLVANMNGDWQPDFYDDSLKFTINRIKGQIVKYQSSLTFFPLCFKSQELRDFSLEHHASLWEQFYQLK